MVREATIPVFELSGHCVPYTVLRSSCRGSVCLTQSYVRAVETVRALHSSLFRALGTVHTLHSSSVRGVETVRALYSSSIREQPASTGFISPRI
jgi:hypothetical protein